MVQDDDKKARRVINKALDDIRGMNDDYRQAVIKEAEVQEKVHLDNAFDYLLEAKAWSTGQEYLSILLELAQRLRFNDKYEDAIIYYQEIA